MDKKELQCRTKAFAHRCVKLALVLPQTQLGKHISGQLIRSSTSVAANYHASCFAQSRSSFAAKISIVLEEADESAFWIEFAVDENLVKSHLADDLLKEAHELVSIFAASRKTAQQK